MIAYGSITISDLSEPFSVIISNDSIHIPTNSSRITSAAQTYTSNIIVYQGTTQRTDFTIGSIQAPNFFAITKQSASVQLAIKSGTSISSDNGIIIIPISLEGSTINKTISWSCTKEGTPAKSVDIISNGLVFKSSDGGENFLPNIVKLTPIFQGGLSFNKWQYSIDNGTTWKDVADGKYGLKVSDSIGNLAVNNKTISVYTDCLVTDSTLNITEGGSVLSTKLSLKSRSATSTHSLLIAKDCALFNNSITSIVFRCISNDTNYYDTATVLRLHDVNGIEFGGVNLLTNTASIKQHTSALCNWTIESKNNVAKNVLDAVTDSQRIVTSNTTNPDSGFYSVISDIQFKKKQHYVYSLAIRGTINQSTIFGMEIFYKNTSGKIVSSSSTSWINDGDGVNDGISQFYFSRRYLPFTIPNDFDETSNYLAVCLYAPNMDVQIRNFQLEKGLNPSPWRQADGDVVSTDTSIATIATVESIVDKVNGEISNKISRTDTIDYTDENGKNVSSTISNFFSESTQNLYGFIWKVFNSNSGSTELSLTDGMIQAITNQFVIKDSSGKSVIIEKGNIKAHAITSMELATDAIKSLNYVANDKFSKTGTFIDLSNGVVCTPSFYIDSTGSAAFKGSIITTSGNIGGFKIAQNSIYSGVKESVGNTTRGIYMDNDGQFVFGDASQYVKFYKISEGKYKLAISLEELFIGSKSVAQSIDNLDQNIRSLSSDNLIINGDGSNGDNFNFTDFKLDGAEQYGGKPSFKHHGWSAEVLLGKQDIPIDVDKTYEFSMYLKGIGKERLYLGFKEVDIDGNIIAPSYCMGFIQTTTTLARDLNDGDTIVYLNSTANWLDTKYYYQLGLIFWNYKDSTGYQYPRGVYSRNEWENLYVYSNVNKTNNTITLNNPWTHGHFSAGTEVSQTNSSGWKYFDYVYNEAPDGWWRKTTHLITGIQDPFCYDSNKFNPAAKKIVFTLLHNYADSFGVEATTYVNNVRLADVTTKTETEAKIKVEADKIQSIVEENGAFGKRLSKVEQDAGSWSVTLETANAAKNAADNASQTASSAKNAAYKANENASSAVSTAQNTVKSTTEQFYKSTSPTSLSGGSWSNSQPTWENGKYIWKRTYVVKNNGTTEYQPSANGVCITGSTGAKGDKGDKGATGATGPQGSTGKGLKSAVDQYYLSTSNTTQSGGSWSNTQPSWVSGKYIWTRTYQTWNDNTTTTTTPVLADALNKANSTASSALSTSSEAMGTATQAKSIANNANSTASSAKSTADTARKEASNAAKTATNYMKFDGTGLTVGNLTDSTLGRNVNIDSSSVNIRNGTNVLAQFAESLIEIGKNTSVSAVSFMNGTTKLISKLETWNNIGFRNAYLLAENTICIGGGSTDPDSDKLASMLTVRKDRINEINADVTDTNGHAYVNIRGGKASVYSDGNAGYSSVNVVADNSTSQVEIHTNGSNGTRTLYNYSHALAYEVNGTRVANYDGTTPCLWDGGAWMFASQSITLSAPISEQPHGIIVIFALFDPTTNSLTNVMTNPFFVPKTAINYDYVFTMFWENAWKMCTKRVTIQNTRIIGNDQNKSTEFTASAGVKSSPQYFVLRRVYGV